jgi:hypothetical protein
MSQELDYGKTPVVPFKAKEGDITIVKTQTATGTITGPSVASPLTKGAAVELDDEMTVKAYSSGIFIGFVYNEGKWVNGEPRTAQNQSTAAGAGNLREVGIETIFKKIVTLTGKTSEGIAAKNYLVWHTDGTVKKSASSGSTASDMIALSAQDSDDRVVVGIL